MKSRTVILILILAISISKYSHSQSNPPYKLSRIDDKTGILNLGNSPCEHRIKVGNERPGSGACDFYGNRYLYPV
jgi:hypothetical protein